MRENKERQINIKGISQDIYELSQQIPKTNKEIYEQGINYYLNMDIETIMQRENLKKELANKKNNIKLKEQEIKQIKILKELEAKQIQQLKEHEIKQLQQEIKETETELSKLEKQINEEDITAHESVHEYNLNKKQKRALEILTDACEKFGLSINDFMSIKRDYVERVAVTNGIDVDDLIKLFLQEKKSTNKKILG